MSLFDKIIEKVDRLQNNILTTRDKHLNRFSKSKIISIKFIIISSIICGLITFLLWSYQKNTGNYPIYEQIPDGAICNDGWKSPSQGSGTCSWHGGVNHYLYQKIQVSTHYANTEPYFIISVSFLLILLGPSLFFTSYRWTVIAYLVALLYMIGNAIAYFPFIWIIIIFCNLGKEVIIGVYKITMKNKK